MVLGKKVTIFVWDGAEIRPLEMGRKGPDFTLIWCQYNKQKSLYGLCVCMEDNPQALASGLLLVHTQTPTITCLLNLHFVHCEIFDIKHCGHGISAKGVIIICNNLEHLQVPIHTTMHKPSQNSLFYNF